MSKLKTYYMIQPMNHGREIKCILSSDSNGRFVNGLPLGEKIFESKKEAVEVLQKELKKIIFANKRRLTLLTNRFDAIQSMVRNEWL